jgi:transposase
MTMCLVDDPDERLEFPPAACCGCGAGLAGVQVLAQRRHQVTDIVPAPAPKVTEYVAQAKECPGCGGGHRGQAAGTGAGAGQFRPGDVRAGREPDLRPPHPGLPGDAAAMPAGGAAVSTGWMGIEPSG